MNIYCAVIKTLLQLITSGVLSAAGSLFTVSASLLCGLAWCHADRISLEVMTLNPVCENVETSEGVPLTVTGVAQVKVMTEPELLSTACEQFLGKAVQHIERVILQTMEGHLRAILGTDHNAILLVQHN